MRLHKKLLLVPTIAIMGTCVFGGYYLFGRISVVRQEVEKSIDKAYRSANMGRFDSIPGWLQGVSGDATLLQTMQARYGKPLFWHPVRTLVQVGGGSWDSRFYVKRERLESVEWFGTGGMVGFAPELVDKFPPPKPLIPSTLISTAGDAVKIARPIIHELDWDLSIMSISADQVGPEWRIVCVGRFKSRDQIRYLILDRFGNPLEHVRAQIADYPAEVQHRVLR